MAGSAVGARPVAAPRRVPLKRGGPPTSGAGLVAAALGSALAFALGIALFDVLGAVFVLVVLATAAILYDFRIGVIILAVLYPVMTPVTAAKLLPQMGAFNPQHLVLLATLGSYLLARITHWQRDYKLVDARLFWLYLVPFVVAGLHAAPEAGRLAGISEEYAEAYGTPARFLTQLVIKPGLMLVFALMLAAAVRESAQPRRFLGVLIAGMVLPAVFIQLYFLASGVNWASLVTNRRFLSELGLHANQFAVQLNVGIAVMLFTALAVKQTLLRVVLFGCALFLAGSLMITFSRGGYLGFALIVVAYIVFSRNWRAALAMVFLLVAAVPFLPDAVFDRITLGWTHGSINQLSSGRIYDLWLPILPEVLDHPIFGNGLLSFGRSDQVLSGRLMGVSQAHNAYLDLLLDVGIVGLILVVAFFWTLWRDFRQQSAVDADPVMRGFFRGAMVGLSALLLQAFFDDRLFPNTPQLFLWMTYGVLVGTHAHWLRQPRKARTHVSRHRPAATPAA